MNTKSHTAAEVRALMDTHTHECTPKLLHVYEQLTRAGGQLGESAGTRATPRPLRPDPSLFAHTPLQM